MRNPTKIPVVQHIKTHHSKGVSIFLERGQVIFRLLPGPPFAKPTAKKWELVVHVNNDTNPALIEQSKYPLGALDLFAQPMAITDSVHPKDKMEKAKQCSSPMKLASQILDQGFVSGHKKFHFFALCWGQVLAR